jgi:pantothenate kinase
MTVGDIYGDKMKLLPKDIIAASLGKVKAILNN